MALTEAALRALHQYALEVYPPPENKAWIHESERAAVREAWERGFEGRPLRVAGDSKGPTVLAWQAGQRFPGSVPFNAPEACAEAPKPAKKAPCRNCKKAGAQCADCRRQIALL